MRNSGDRFFIVTGGPGAGKTALVEALAVRGYGTMREGGRAIIRDQIAQGGDALPWADRAAFAALMLIWDVQSYKAALDRDRPVIFDRGIPDVLGFLRLCELPVPADVERAVAEYLYSPRVFIAPFWPRIYDRDAERLQSPEEAERTCRVLTETYTDLGYELLPLPLASVEERVRFVIEEIGIPARGLRAPD